MTDRRTDIDAWFDEQEEPQTSQLPVADVFADLRSPDEVASERTIAEELGQPPAAVRAYPDIFARSAEVSRTQRAVEATPRLRNWLSQPENFAVARDDVENLSAFERLSQWAYHQGDRYRAIGRDYGDAAALHPFALQLDPIGTASHIARRLTTDSAPLENPLRYWRSGELDVETGQLQYRRADLERQGLALSPEDEARLAELRAREDAGDWGPFIIGPTLRVLPQQVESFTRGWREAGRRRAEAFESVAGTEDERRERARMAMSGELGRVENMALNLRDAVLGGTAAGFGAIGGFGGGYLSTVYEFETGGLYDSLRQEGIEADIAYRAASEYGTWATALEFTLDATGLRAMGALRLISRPFLKESALRAAGAPLTRAGAAVIGGAAAGGTEEASQRVAEIIHEDLARQESQGAARDVFQAWSAALTPESIQSILESGYIGLQAGAGIASVPATANFALDMRAAQQAERGAQVFEEMTRAAQASRLNARNLGSTLESAVAAVNDSQVFIDADRFIEHFQSQGANAYAVADELGIGSETLARAVRGSGQVEMPTAVLAARVLRLPQHAGLAEHVRIAPDADTAAEAKVATARLQAEIERIAIEAQGAQRDNEIGQAVEARVRALFAEAEQDGGPRADIAQRYAKLVAALPRTLVARARLSGDAAYADRLETQLSRLFGEDLDIAGPARDLEAQAGVAEMEQRGKGPDAGPVRNDRWTPPDGVRLNERQRSIAEMAMNGASNEWIAAEWETSPHVIDTTLSVIKSKLGGKAPWERGANAGRSADVPIERLVRARDQLLQSGYPPNRVNAILAERFSMTAPAVGMRLMRYDRAQAAKQAAEQIQGRRAQPFDLDTAEGRQQWFEEEVYAEPIPGEAADARNYGFALDTGEIIVMSVAPEPTGSATVEWTFLERLKAQAQNPDADIDMFGPGAEKLGLRGVLNAMARVLAILEADMAEFRRDAYVYTPNNDKLESIYKHTVNRNVRAMPYQTVDDGAGTFYLVRDGAEIARNGTVIRSPENANVKVEWPQVDPDEVRDLQNAYYERLERFAKSGADEGDRSDSGRPDADRGGAEAGSGVSGTGEPVQGGQPSEQVAADAALDAAIAMPVVAKRFAVDPRDFILMFNEGLTDGEIAAEIALSAEGNANGPSPGSVAVWLTHIRSAVRRAREADAIDYLAERMAITADELTAFVDAIHKTRKPTLVGAARNLIKLHDNNTARVIAELAKWAEENLGRQLERSALDITLHRARQAMGIAAPGRNRQELNQSQPAFYSAVERALEQNTTARAPGSQWWATISKAQGVKKEELQWLGLEDWLKAQEGPIAREDVLTFVRERGVRVEETVLDENSVAPEVQRELLPLMEERDRLQNAMMDGDNSKAIAAATQDERVQAAYRAFVEAEQAGVDALAQELDAGEPRVISEDQWAWVIESSSGQRRVSKTDYDRRGLEGALADVSAIDRDRYKAIHRLADQKRLELRSEARDLRSRLSERISELEGERRKTDTRWSQYTLPGGENYRELILYVPGIEPYAKTDTVHYGDVGEGRAIAWIRFKERVDVNGRRTLHVDEFQSKRHQDARERGYKSDDEFTVSNDGGSIWRVRDANGQRVDTIDGSTGFSSEQLARDAIATGQMRSNSRRVPDAPFKNNAWASLAMKRMIRWAAENGFEQIAWTPGRVQVERFNLATMVERVSWGRREDGNYDITITRRDGGPSISRDNQSPADLAELIGQDAARRITSDAGVEYGTTKYSGGPRIMATGEITGDDLQAGGHGMRVFYDKILPNIANDLGKKFGARTGETQVGIGRWDVRGQNGERLTNVNAASTEQSAREVARRAMGYVAEDAGTWIDTAEFSQKTETVHSLPITPEMREAAMEGMALFQGRQTTTLEFRRWFGDSKVVDESGAPLVVYHGTTANVEEFDTTSERPAGQARKNDLSYLGSWFSTSTEVASKFAVKVDAWGDVTSEEGANVLPVYLSLQNPRVFETRPPDQAKLQDIRDQIEALRKEGAQKYGSITFRAPRTMEEVADQTRLRAEREALYDQLSIESSQDALEQLMDESDQFAEYISGAKGKTGHWRKRYIKNNYRETMEKMRALLIEQGHDGVILRNTAYDADGGVDTQYVAFFPEQIKSAIGNSGAFDPNNPNIAMQGEARGSIRYQNFRSGEFGQAVIRMGQSSDLSTFLHEFGHLGHLVLESIASDPQAPAEFKTMWDNTLSWWGVSQDQWNGFSVEQKRDYFELWARSFEAYLMEGKAPSLTLREAFAAFKAWLTQIYRSVFKIDQNLNPQIRDVFDRLLATDQEMTEARAAMGADFSFTREAFKSDEEFAKYQQAIAEAREAADAELRARVMDKYVRKDKRWWRSERERIRTTAEIAVDSDPARRAYEWLAFTEWRALPVEQNEEGVSMPADASLAMPEDLPAMTLSAQAMLEEYGENAFDGLPVGLRPLSAADVDAALDNAMALKRQGRQRQPQRLWAFIKAQGGIKDIGGEIRQALGSGRNRPGLINNATGLDADELALRAWEAGYFGAVPRKGPMIEHFQDGTEGPDAGASRGEQLYHGTSRDYDWFDLSAPPSRTGVVPGESRAIWLTSDEAQGMDFARLQQLNEGGTPRVIRADGVDGRILTHNAFGALYDDVPVNKILERARRQGYAGVRFRNMREDVGEGRVPDQIAVFDAANVRRPPSSGAEQAPRAAALEGDVILPNREMISPATSTELGPVWGPLVDDMNAASADIRSVITQSGHRMPDAPNIDPAALDPARRATLGAIEGLEDFVRRQRLANAEAAARLPDGGSGRVEPADTRGQGRQYHGARGPIEALEEGYYNDANFYGPYALYTSDAVDVAGGYQRRKAAGVTYEVRERTPVNMFDMERPLTREEAKDILGPDALGTDALEQLDGTPNLREIMDEMRDLGTNYEMSRADIQEDFAIIQDRLMERGFGGMSHTGGLRTGRAPHLVKLYFEPHTQIELIPVRPQTDAPTAGNDVADGFEMFQDEVNADRRPTPTELLNALIDDIKNVRQVYSVRDEAAVAAYQNRADAIRWFEARGIDLDGSKDEIRAQIEEALTREAAEQGEGWHPDDIAPWFGFESGDAMIQAMKGLEPRAVAIENFIDTSLDQQYGDPLRDGTTAEAARFAAHVDAQSRKIELELEAIQRATNGRRTPVGKAARAYAERQIDMMTVKQVRGYESFLAGERRAARNAMEAVEKGDMIEAGVWKQRQLINFHLYRLARNAADEMDKAQRYFKKFESDGVRGRIHPPLMDQIDQALEGVDLRTAPFMSNRRRQAFLQWLDEMKAEGLDHMIAVDPAIIEAARRRPFNTLTLEEARGLRDAVRNFEHIGRRWREVISSRDKRLMEEAVSEMVQTIEANGQIISEKRKGFSPDALEYLNEQRLRYHAEHTKPEFLFRLLDGLKDSGPVWRNLFAPIARAEDAEMEMRNAAAARMSQAFGVYTRAERGRLFTKKRMVTAIGRSMTKAERLAVALNWGNEGNRQALMEGYQWNEQQVEAILDGLDQRDWQVVQEIWAWLEEYRAPSFALQERLTGVAPKAVEGMDVRTNFGVIKGSYYPLRYDPQQGERAFRREEQSRTLEEWGSNWVRPQTRQGHLQARVGSGGQKVRLDLNVLSEHVENVIHDITHREAVIGTLRFIENKRLQEAIIDAVGREQYRQLRPWLSRIASDIKDPSSVWERVLLRLRMGASVVNMGYKITTAIVQPLGLLNAAPRVGGAALSKAVMSFYAQPHKMRDAIGFVFERSPFMKNRMATFDRDVRDAMNRIRGRADRDPIPFGVRQSFFWMTGIMDMSVSVPTWLAAYDNAMGGKIANIAGGDEKAAAEHADSVVRTTQGAGGPKDLTGYTGSKREILRLFTMFYSYMSNLYNQLYVEQTPGVQRGRIPLHVFVGNMMMLWFLPAAGAILLQGRWEGEDDETDEERFMRIAGEIGGYPLMTMVGLRDVANAVITPYDYSLTPTTEAFERTVGAARRLTGSLDDGEIDQDELRAIMKDMTLASGYWLAIPARQMWITGEAITDIITGEDDLSDPIDTASEVFMRDRR